MTEITTSEALNEPDRELLRLAAYALDFMEDIVVPDEWNPLQNDQEAFWLAATLRININFPGNSAVAQSCYQTRWRAEVAEALNDMAAVRRVIVAVAAMQGRLHWTRRR